jgi:hypothetical protein
MKQMLFITIVSCILFFNACNLTTLYPIFKIKDIVFNQQLLGHWKLSNSQKDSDLTEIERVTSSVLNDLPNDSLQKIAGKGYLITTKDKQQNIITRHLAFLVKIGKYQYMDYYPLETDEEKKYDDFYKVHYIRIHSFSRIDFKTDQSFELKQFDLKFIQQQIDTRQISVRHELQPYLPVEYIITASTEELQAYITKYADDPHVYTEQTSSYYIKVN